MNDKEIWELECWISLNVTKTLRRLSDAEYAEVVKECEDVNLEPHPNLELTQPSRFVGVLSRYTDPADAMEVLKKCMNRERIAIENENGVVKVGQWNSDQEKFSPFLTGYAETLELALFQFAKKLFSRGT
jgi:hypothetical protein